MNFTPILSNQGIKNKRYSNGNFIILLLYVDNMIVVGNDVKEIGALKEKLCNKFAMNDLSCDNSLYIISSDCEKCILWVGTRKVFGKGD